MLSVDVKPIRRIVAARLASAVTRGPRSLLDVEGVARTLLRRAKALSKKRTGTFAKGWRVDITGNTQWNRPLFRLYNVDPQALAIEYGSRGGMLIVPVHAKALRFRVGGKTVFARSVRRGRTRPQGVLRKLKSEIPAILAAHVR